MAEVKESRKREQTQSLLAVYDGKKVETRTLPGRFRGVAWDKDGASLTLVGDMGGLLRVQGNRLVKIGADTKHNLRAISTSQVRQTSLAVGNAGTIISIGPGDRATELKASTFENLRTVRWNGEGNTALIGGNNGVLIKYAKGTLTPIDGLRANLRGISWRNKTEALITSNCFAGEFVPSPNLFAFNAKENTVTALNEDRSDLVGVAWKPDGISATVVGYDVVWHNGFIARFQENRLLPIPFENQHVYPVAVGWDTRGRIAAIATSTPQQGSSYGKIILWEEGSFKEIFRSARFFFSSIAWAPTGRKLAALASTENRTFNS